MSGKLLVLGVLLSTLLLYPLSIVHADAAPTGWTSLTGWTRSSFPLGGGHIIESSPVLADIDRDGQEEIIVGTTAEQCVGGNCGSTAQSKLVVANPDGSVLWARDTGAPIRSSPSVGDLDGNGTLEIVVSVGGDVSNTDHNGGVLAYDSQGNLLWRFNTQVMHPPYTAGVFSTPALCDINNDGRLEIAFGAWDHRIYLLSDRGALLWNHLNDGGPGYLNGDTVWSSPACADVNRDGYPEIIIGADITGGGYLPDGTPTQDGGFLYVFARDGRVLARRYLPETVYSSPAVGDLNRDGNLEIVVGTGWFWWEHHGFSAPSYVYAFGTANLSSSLAYADPAKLPYLPGWPQRTDYPGFSSPALADLDGDGDLEIIIGTGDPYYKGPDQVDGAGSVYAWHHTGQLVGGWPVHPKSRDGYDTGVRSSPVVADLDNDGMQEILFSMVWDVQVYKANGRFQDRFETLYTAWASPAVGDADGDGKVEVWIGAGNAEEQSQGYLWRFKPPFSSDRPQAWPVFHANNQHIGLYPRPISLSTTPDSVWVLHDPRDLGSGSSVDFTLTNPGDLAVDWTLSEQMSTVTATPTSGLLGPGRSVTIRLQVATQSFTSPGDRKLGDITIQGQAQGESVQKTVGLYLRVGHLSRIWTPLLLSDR